jgi:tetratricopeptide (TPR) repeat protein
MLKEFKLMNLLRWIVLLLLLLNSISIYAQNTDDIALANEYYNEGEFEKARQLYEDLSKNEVNLPLIHQNYYNLLLNTAAFQDAEKYIERLIKRYSGNIYYKIDKLKLFNRIGESGKEQAYFNSIKAELNRNADIVRIAAQYMNNHQLYEYALNLYKEGRQALGDPFLFSIELANTYRFLNMKDQMVEEFLNFVQQNPANIKYVKNILQNYLTEEDDLVNLEKMLLEKVQREPDNQVYNDMLIWVNLQQKNFYGAFMQARAIDKRMKLSGDNSMDVGIITLDNKDYETAIRIFDYIIQNYPKALNYPLAKSYIIKSREELIKNKFPVEKAEIRKLIKDYQYLINELGFNSGTMDALRSMALLHAFYLSEFDTAVQILQKMLSYSRLPKQLEAKVKIDLGDIFLLTGEPWESALLYAQVEKSEKETPIAYEAKLKNAKLAFYKGDFKLAQDHLDILKLATSREIANDAISLSLLIKDNTIIDTSDLALKKYAAIELLLFQNKKQASMDSLQAMLETFKGHNITDEIYWLMAKIKLELGEFQESIKFLEKITSEYSTDILSDDAMFQIGEIYEQHLGEKEMAMQIYQEFMKIHPGSIYSAEARKRFRKLRGDFVN